ncbi:MAG: nuclear transport factor 2 family protein [Candidatus Latescibacteria bacterium]|nr:nuclear transport factor 2 family protein [Candidatus Latescibacterota bacterium]
MTAEQTVQTYFDALAAGDANKLMGLMSTAEHYVKIGTDKDEIVYGGTDAPAYYQHHVASTQDFTIQIDHLDVQERDDLAYFVTLQTWQLKWQGTFEILNMRLTGVLEKENSNWKFVQIHASLGAEE